MHTGMRHSKVLIAAGIAVSTLVVADGCRQRNEEHTAAQRDVGAAQAVNIFFIWILSVRNAENKIAKLAVEYVELVFGGLLASRQSNASCNNA